MALLLRAALRVKHILVPFLIASSERTERHLRYMDRAHYDFAALAATDVGYALG